MQGHVTILSFSRNADEIIASGGRISTMDGTADEIYRLSEQKGTEKNRSLIRKVMSSGHTSVLEHASVNLSFENVSVFAEQFIIEFRLASFTVKSRRYVDFANAGHVRPETLTGEQEEIFEGAVQRLFGIYAELEQAGVPKEDARFVLPYCFCSNFFCSMNARELLHMMNELVYGRGSAYPELVALGESLFAQCEEQLPYLAVRKPERYRPAPLPELPELRRLEPQAPVEILSAPENAEKLICDAALIGRGFAPRELSEAQTRALLQSLIGGTRRRELEQAHFTILFAGMSLAALTHLTRHRMQCLVAPDLLMNADCGRFVLPQSVTEAGQEALYREAFRLAGEASDRLSALGAGRDVLSYLLLSGQTVPVLTTMNAGELCTFFRLRCCTRAQWEIRACAEQALAALRKKAPVLFSLYGPSCYMLGACPEGRMCCGQMARMQEKYGGEL